MKKITALLILLLCFSLLFSGCRSFRLASSIDDLISPVAPSGENASVQNALDEFCKGGYSIKIPISGDYTTSFIFYDLDADKINEAIAFYEPSNNLGTVNMAVIKKNNDKWSVIDNIKGDATDVNAVDFCDVNNDGTVEILVCWSVISKTTGSNLNVYRQQVSDDKYSLKQISDSVTAAKFLCVDINSDGVNEVLVFTNGTSSESPKAELYSFTDNKKKLLGLTKLDSRITSYQSIIQGETDEGVCVYADAVKSDGDSMVTEFIYWSDYYDSIVSPFYSYSTGITGETSRSSMLICRDIDNDDTIEIPVDSSIKDLPSQITAQNWKAYENTVLVHKCYSLSCRRDGYVLVIPDKYYSKIKVKYDSDAREMKVLSKSDNKECFTVITEIVSSYNSNDEKYEGYTQILSDSGFVYLAKTEDNSEIKVTVEQLKDMIRAY
ncbi:MAG: hypothetical protein ACI4IQ_03970 [Eubacterium sp.]